MMVDLVDALAIARSFLARVHADDEFRASVVERCARAGINRAAAATAAAMLLLDRDRRMLQAGRRPAFPDSESYFGA
jgi:hypothetical protein